MPEGTLSFSAAPSHVLVLARAVDEGIQHVLLTGSIVVYQTSDISKYFRTDGFTVVLALRISGLQHLCVCG